MICHALTRVLIDCCSDVDFSKFEEENIVIHPLAISQDLLLTI